jgi:hypothetical protein
MKKVEQSKTKTFSKKVEDFTCEVCSTKNKGTGYTDHCSNCLWGKHVDINPGDRMSKCHGQMKPIKAMHDRNGFLVIYECTKCKTKKKIRAAEKDNKELLFELVSR